MKIWENPNPAQPGKPGAGYEQVWPMNLTGQRSQSAGYPGENWFKQPAFEFAGAVG